MTTWVKICGVCRPEDAAVCVDAGADAIGLNFHPASRRYCEPHLVPAILQSLPERFPVYGVFVDRSREQISEAVVALGLRGIQLHGDEPPALCEGWELPVIRAVKAVSSQAVVAAVQASKNWRVLVDNPAGGGTGTLVEEQVLEGLDLSEVVLAGGLTPDNVAARVAALRPFGVDVAGGVESRPGVKDHKKIREFIEHARAA